MLKTKILIKEINSSETLPIRKEILRPDIDLPCEFKGDNDAETFHLGAIHNEEVIGVVSFIRSDNSIFTKNQYQMRGMAIVAAHRKRGIGKMLIQEALDLLEKKEVAVLWCNARETAVQFYEKFGFKTLGEKFMIDHIGTHYLMYYKPA